MWYIFELQPCRIAPIAYFIVLLSLFLLINILVGMRKDELAYNDAIKCIWLITACEVYMSPWMCFIFHRLLLPSNYLALVNCLLSIACITDENCDGVYNYNCSDNPKHWPWSSWTIVLCCWILFHIMDKSTQNHLVNSNCSCNLPSYNHNRKIWNIFSHSLWWMGSVNGGPLISIYERRDRR